MSNSSKTTSRRCPGTDSSVSPALSHTCSVNRRLVRRKINVRFVDRRRREMSSPLTALLSSTLRLTVLETCNVQPESSRSYFRRISPSQLFLVWRVYLRLARNGTSGHSWGEPQNQWLLGSCEQRQTCLVSNG